MGSVYDVIDHGQALGLVLEYAKMDLQRLMSHLDAEKLSFRPQCIQVCPLTIFFFWLLVFVWSARIAGFKLAQGMMKQLLSALAYCHRNHFIHCDLKPGSFCIFESSL